MVPTPDALSHFSALQVQPAPDLPLSAAQQRYNALLSRLELLTTQLERLQAWSDRHRHDHVQALYQAAQSTQALRSSLLLYLHGQLQTDVLTAPQQRIARTLVRQLMAQLGPAAPPQVQVLEGLYRQDDDDEALVEERAQDLQQLRGKIEAALGQPLQNPTLYNTPEEMLAAGMRQWQRQQQADDARKAAKRAARKARQRPAAHEEAQAQQADARLTIRTLYRQLASALHPDRETDPFERQRKTARMSEVNAAYERNDLATLLRLQMQEALAGGAVSHLADERLAGMCLLLKAQVTALERDLASLQSELTQSLCVPVSSLESEEAMTQALQQLQAQQRQQADTLSADLQRIQNEAELKRWLKEQHRAFKAASA